MGAFRMQLLGVIVKEARKAELTAAVAGRWDIGNYSPISCLTGTDMATKQQTALVFPEAKIADLIQLARSSSPMAVVKVVGGISMPAPGGYESYECYLAGKGLITVEAVTGNSDMLPALFKGKAFEAHEVRHWRSRRIAEHRRYKLVVER